MPEGPLLWFANRGTGLVLLVLLTVTVVLGVLSTRGPARRGLPRFLTHAVHRNVALLAVTLLVVHVATAVVDEYVDIRWWQALVPVGATYQPLWLGLGTVALDLLVAVTVTSLLRHRMGHRPWRVLHLTTYVAWAAALVHGLRIGTDSGEPFASWTYVGCAGALGAAALVRLGRLLVARVRRRPAVTALPAGVAR